MPSDERGDPREALVTRILTVQGGLGDALEQVLQAQQAAVAARMQLAADSNDLILGGGITGRNAEERNAQLQATTWAQQQLVQAREQEQRRAAGQYDLLREELKSLRACARLLGAS